MFLLLSLFPGQTESTDGMLAAGETGIKNAWSNIEHTSHSETDYGDWRDVKSK